MIDCCCDACVRKRTGEDDECRFSRGGSTSPFGKSADEIRVMVPEQIKQELIAMAVLHGLSVSEYCRQVLVEHLHGSLVRIRNKNGRGYGGNTD